MKNRLQKVTMAMCVISVVSIIPMFVLSLMRTGSIQRAVLSNYFSIPFFAVCSAGILILAGILLYIWHKAGQENGSFGIFSLLVPAGIALTGICLIYLKVITPLQDLPYLDQPSETHLENVTFAYNNMGDSPTIQISGEDAQGEEVYFSIDKETYEEGEALYQETSRLPGNHMVVADVSYLPHSGTVVGVDIRSK